MCRIIPLISFLAIHCLSIAQQKKIVFDHYGTQQGFNSRVCRTVVKTKDGMIWITTQDGLVRYDSKKFRYFQHIPYDSTSIASDFTDQMVADNNGKLWIVAESGLDIFDPQTEKFSHCYIVHDGVKKKDFSPESLYFDSLNDRIWAGTWLGLYYCNTNSLEFVKAKTDAASSEIMKRVFIDIKPMVNGGLWLCNALGIYNYNTSTGHAEILHIADSKDKLANDDAFCLFPENDEMLWVGTWSHGLVRYNLKTNSVKRYYYFDPQKEQNGIIFINQTGLASEKDILWISTPNASLGTFNKKEERFEFYYTDLENDKNGIKGTTNRLLPTATEGMWIASENGLHRYDYAKQLFREINFSLLNPSLNKALPAQHLCISPSANRNDSLFWFFIPYINSFSYNNTSGKLEYMPAALQHYLSAEVYACYIDAAGVYWAGTDKFGLIGYDLQGDKLIFPEHIYFFNDWEWVTDFFEDRKGRLWLATYNGLFFIDKERTKVAAADAVNRELSSKGLSLNVHGIAMDNKDRLWLTTGSNNNKARNAITVYDITNNTVTIYHENQNKKQGFPADAEINNITCCGQQLFVATSSGLLTFSSIDFDPVFTLHTMQDGLVGNNIGQVICDRQSNIWCSTDFGVSCYLPARNFFINYTHSQSGIGPQKMPEMYLSSNSGNIYFCQQAGLNYLSPQQISIEAPPRIYFTGMQLFNKPFLYKNKQLQTGDIIRLKHDQNMISVEFTGMSYSKPDDNQFAYKLEGLEEEWNISKNNIASYTNLAPGKYRLLVKTSNSSGVWTPEPATITFIISPPFWKTWWFISLIVLVVAAVLYSLYRYRINQLVRLQKIRNTISRNLHDEIGSTLTSISILSNVSQQAIEKDPQQAKEMLQKIASQSKTIQQNMSDIVWAIRSDNDRVENLLVRIREYAAQTLEPTNVKTDISMDESLINKSLSMEARKEVLLIVKEAVTNIAKHSRANRVMIALQQKDHHLQLTIKDNGHWRGNGKSSGTGISSMQQRANSIGGNAEIEYDDSGTTVTVIMPIT